MLIILTAGRRWVGLAAYKNFLQVHGIENELMVTIKQWHRQDLARGGAQN